MAGPACMSQDGREAVFVGTMLSTGDAYSLCDECLASWAIALVSTMTGIDPAPFILAISDDGPAVDPNQLTVDDAAPSDSGSVAAQEAAQDAAGPPGNQPAAPKKRGGRRAENPSGPTPGGSAGPGTGGARGTAAGVTQTNSAPPTV